MHNQTTNNKGIKIRYEWGKKENKLKERRFS